MGKYILKRVLETIPVLFGIITVTFFMVRLAPGGPFDDEKALSTEAQVALDAHYGLDQPLIVQYGNYLGGLLRGDLGPMFTQPNFRVSEIIAEKFPVSLELGLFGLAVAFALGVAAGTIASLRPNSAVDYSAMTLAMVGICLPTFVIGPLLALTFGLQLGWFDVAGWDSPGDRVLPAATLGIYYAAYIARLTRGSMLEHINRDYIRTARAKGLSAARTYLVHALRNAILPVLSYLGPAAAGLVTGSIVVETVFGIPGLGTYFVDAAFNRDYFMVLGTVLFYGTLLITLNLATDILQAWLNPRQRVAG